MHQDARRTTGWQTLGSQRQNSRDGQREAGIGAGSDSFYEYLLKAWLVLGDAAALDRFVEAYVEASLHMPVQHGKNVFWLDVHMNTGRRSKEWVSSLGAV